MNGRAGSDKYLGKFTCKNVSTVDYIIISMNLFQKVEDFTVDDMNPLFSDIHCPIQASFQRYCIGEENVNPLEIQGNPMPAKPIWSQNKTEKFLHNIDINTLVSINTDIELVDLESNQGYMKANIENIVHKVTGTLVNAAKHCNMLPSKTRKVKIKCSLCKRIPNKPWFNAQCKEQRKLFYRAKANCKRLQTSVSYEEMKNKSKNYKICLTRAKCEYQNKLCKELRGLKSSDPKKYWSILNRELDQNKDSTLPVSLIELLNHFKKLSFSGDITRESIETKDDGNPPNFIKDLDMYGLNVPFSVSEVKIAIKKLHNNKACGLDQIINEFFKAASPIMLFTITKLFNLILDAGVVPEGWSVGIIKPIYKNKGKKTCAENYRGITLLSCFGKLFTSILNTRLTNYLDRLNILGQDQAGFRKGYSTNDHIFVLKHIVDLFLNKGLKLYCIFVDYKTAFDKINRVCLWQKLVSNLINGKIYKCIYSLYQNSKSCIQYNGKLSDYFVCNTGVRQGENLSPLLFAIYLNDLSKVLIQQYEGLPLIYNLTYDQLGEEYLAFCKFYILLYADDTAILAENPRELQCSLNALYEYCKSNDLTVNTTKTKVMVFSKGKIRKLPTVTFGERRLDIVFEYHYLGVIFNYNGTFSKNITNIVDKGHNAMYRLLNCTRKLNLPMDLSLDMFESIVIPVITYGCEIWGMENIAKLETLQLKY